MHRRGFAYQVFVALAILVSTLGSENWFLSTTKPAGSVLNKERYIKMSNFKTVLDFLNAVPKAAKHESIYREYMGNEMSPECKEYDMSKLEFSMLGHGERNLLRDMVMPDKFCKEGFEEGFKLESSSWAKQVNKTPGKGSLNYSKEYDENFLCEKSIYLRSCDMKINDSKRPGVLIPKNEALYNKIVNAFNAIRENQLSSVALTYVGEKLMMRSDMRRVFLKAYLMVQSYNLAITSRRTSYQFRNVKAKCMRDSASDERKVARMMSHAIVVKSSYFSTEQIWLLLEICSEYPTTRYGQKNIYNAMRIEADDLLIFTEPGFELGDKPGYGSPERMWKDIVDIAIKMGAVEDLVEVVRDFRGMPGMLKNVCEKTGKNLFYMPYPASYSARLAIESSMVVLPVIKKHSGYFATSKCLVADLLLSHMMVMSIYNVIEELGAFSSVGLPTKEAKKDPIYTSNLRNWGLRSEAEDENSLLQEWRGVRNDETIIPFNGRLRDFTVKLAEEIRAGDTSMLRPQLLFALPYSSCKNTTWATIRGWRFRDFNFSSSKEEKVRENLLLKAYTWVMGVSDKVPRVGLNGLGNKVNDEVSNAEFEFTALAGGEYVISLVRHRVAEDLEARVDDIELGSELFYSTGFPGTRSSVVFDADGAAKLTIEVVDDKSREATHTMAGADSGDDGMYSGSEEASGSEGDDEVDVSICLGEQMVDENGKLVSSKAKGYDKSKDKGKAKMYEEDRKRESSDSSDEEIRKMNRKGMRSDDDEGEEKKKKDGEKDPSKVVVHRAPLIRVRKRPVARYTDDGKVKPVAVTTITGHRVELLEYPHSYDPMDGNVNGYLLQTPGDGQCGLHAIVQNLMVYGFLTEPEKEEAFRNLQRESVEKEFHSVTQLAHLCNTMNMGLYAIVESDRKIYRMGTRDSLHNVWIHHNVHQNHYSTFIPNKIGNTRIRGYAIKYEPVPPHVFLDNIRRSKALLAGNRWIEKSAEARIRQIMYELAEAEKEAKRKVDRSKRRTGKKKNNNKEINSPDKIRGGGKFPSRMAPSTVETNSSISGAESDRSTTSDRGTRGAGGRSKKGAKKWVINRKSPD